MTDRLWPTEVSGRLSELLAAAFTGVRFQIVPLAAYEITTLDVAWTDGPSLHEVDEVALDFVLRAHLDSWGTPRTLRIDRISKRRTMSPSVEERLLKVLASEMGMDAGRVDMEKVHPLPPALGSVRYSAEKGTVREFLDMLFEATSFAAAELNAAEPDAGGREPGGLLCRCTLCA